ncbi:MAG: hypothetical protein RLO50_15865 [Azospirillaceae bacterium]
MAQGLLGTVSAASGLVAGACLVAAVSAPVSALAEAVDTSECPIRSRVISYLAEAYDEAPIAIGMANNGDLIEILNNPSGGTWTILVTSPEGRSCLVAAGRDLELLETYQALTDETS